MKKTLSLFLFLCIIAISSNASTANSLTNDETVKIENVTATENDVLDYPSGCGTFTDDCGNDVGFCWSCNFDCSSGQVAAAVTSFVSGYGCGNYDQSEYPY